MGRSRYFYCWWCGELAGRVRGYVFRGPVLVGRGRQLERVSCI